MVDTKENYTPFYGYYSPKYPNFFDYKLFENKEKRNIILKKIKIWYGTPSVKENPEHIKGSGVLGIETEYHNIVNGKRIISESHCGKLDSNDIVIKNIELKDGDFITKFFLCFNEMITYIKFVTKRGDILEIGKYQKTLEKQANFNDEKYPHMILNFYGYYNDYGLRAIGCSHIERKKFIFLHLFGLFQLRHILKTDNKKKEFWSNEEEIKKLSPDMQTVVRLCLIPDSPFFGVIAFCC